MSTSKTARASAVKTSSEKVTISDADYIKTIRADRAAGLHVNPTGVDAVLRALDGEQANTADAKKQVDSALALVNAHMSVQRDDLDDALRNLLQVLVTTQGNLATLEQEFAAIKAVINQ